MSNIKVESSTWHFPTEFGRVRTLLFSGRNLHRVECFSQCWPYVQSEIDAATLKWYIFTELPWANPVIKWERGCLLCRKMTKLHNSYPEDIACVVCFPRVWIYSWSIRRLIVLAVSFRYHQFISSQYVAVETSNSETSAFRVNLFRLLSWAPAVIQLPFINWKN